MSFTASFLLAVRLIKNPRSHFSSLKTMHYLNIYISPYSSPTDTQTQKMALSDSDGIEAVAMPARADVDHQLAALATGLCSGAEHAKDGEADPFLVAFASSGADATNPLDWRAGKKWMVTDVLSATGFNRIMVSTIMAPALPTIARELGMNPTEAALSMSIYLLATAFGPLVIGPLSELYGRQAVLHGSNIWFLVWNILCGFAATKETLIAARFLAGFGASAIYSLGAGVLGDVWRPEQRGRSLGVYLLIPLLGAAVGMSEFIFCFFK